MTTSTIIDQWQDYPDVHTTATSIAAKLRALAAALESLGDIEIAKTWPHLSIQVCGEENPTGRKAAVDAIAEALGMSPATGGTHTLYTTADFKAVCVYTAKLHQPGCCEHCTLAGGAR